MANLPSPRIYIENRIVDEMRIFPFVLGVVFAAELVPLILFELRARFRAGEDSGSEYKNRFELGAVGYIEVTSQRH